MIARALFFISVVVTFSHSAIAQRGKNGTHSVTTAGSILNAYTTLSANATAGATSISVANNALNTNFFTTVGSLAAGDLILIIQMQGVQLNGTAIGVGGGNFQGSPLDHTLGEITDYGNCGRYEFIEVTGVSGTNTINLRCGLQHSYTAAGRVQVIRIPRFTTLLVNGGASVTAPAWDGSTGGIVAIETEGNLTLNGQINVNALGFRGGQLNNSSAFGAGQMAATNPIEGAEKGEGIAGYDADYTTWGGKYGRASFANAGGGSTAHNAGGGGGANAASIGWFHGLGNPAAGFNAAWDIEFGVTIVGFAWSPMDHTTTSGGGGRGGYTFSNVNRNAAVDSPNNTLWGADNRRIQGGLGGRPLDYSSGRAFMAGGGGAGDMNDNQGGAGGRGAGMVFLQVYGNVSGAGAIQANGANGQNSNSASPPLGDYAGKDGAGGGGAGGTVFVRAAGTISTITIQANGGNGGNNTMVAGSFGSISAAYGPGGGGGGGYVSTSSAGATVTLNAGVNGTTNSPHLTEFPPNGATSGSTGVSNTTLPAFNLTVNSPSICAGNTATLNATISGTNPGGTITWYSDLNGTVAGTGVSFTTPVLSATTTYYVGLCPGSFLIPATVTVTPAVNINVTNLNIVNETCGLGNGSISGITASGGGGPLTYSWTGGLTTLDISGIGAGSFTLTVSDGTCSATSGPYVLSTTSGVNIDASGLVIVDENCNNAQGSITGITASGGTGALTYSWSTGQSTADIINLSSGTYTLTVTDALSCSASVGPFTVNNLGAPTIDISGLVVSPETCSNSNGSVTGIVVSGGTGTYTFLWNGASSTLDQTNLNAGTYTLVVDDGTICQVTAGPFVVADQTGPVIDVTGMVIVDEHCGQSDGSITGIVVNGGTAPLTITWNGVPSTLDQIGISIDVYQLVVTDANGCSDSHGLIDIWDIPGPVMDESLAVVQNENCVGSNGSVTGISVTGGTAPLSYQWNGSSSVSPDLTGVLAGSYTLVVTDGFGCSVTSATYNIQYLIPPVLDASAVVIVNDSCQTGQGSISGIVLNGGTAPITFSWNGTPSAGIDFIGTNGTYTLVVSDGEGCQDSAGPFTIGGTIAVVGSVSGPTTACLGASVTLTASGGIVYSWGGGNLTNVNTFNLTQDSTLLVIVSNGDCLDSVYAAVTVQPLPIIAVGTVNPACPGTSVTMTATSTSPISWSSGGVGASETIVVTSTQYFYATATNACGTATDSVLVTALPTPVIDAGDDVIISLGSSTNLEASGGISYSWSPSSGLSCTNCASPVASPTSTTIYEVIGTNANGCSASNQVTVTVEDNPVVWLPDAFSPNGDGYNDVFQVYGSGIEEMMLRVFDRWGNLVFESNDQSMGWDGSYKGGPLGRATFGYTLSGKFNNGNTFEQAGNVTLMR